MERTEIQGAPDNSPEQNTAQPPEQQKPAEQTFREMLEETKTEYEQKLAAKDAEINKLRTDHAKEIRDILTGRDQRAPQAQSWDARINESYERIIKNLGAAAQRQKKKKGEE